MRVDVKELWHQVCLGQNLVEERPTKHVIRGDNMVRLILSGPDLGQGHLCFLSSQVFFVSPFDHLFCTEKMGRSGSSSLIGFIDELSSLGLSMAIT